MFDKHKRESLLLRDLLKKLIIIVIGSIVAAYGITLALYAGFGGATLAVLWQGIAETFHLSIGMASFVVAVGMILFALKYSLQGTTQGRYLTGGVPPVRFSM